MNRVNRSLHSRFIAIIAALAVAPGILLAGGCKRGGVEQISRLLGDPGAFYDRDVTVAGRVVRVFDPTGGFLPIAAYQIDDGSGRIWVLSRGGTPSVGKQVGVKARVRKDFQLGSELLGAVLNEQERRTR